MTQRYAIKQVSKRNDDLWFWRFRKRYAAAVLFAERERRDGFWLSVEVYNTRTGKRIT